MSMNISINETTICNETSITSSSGNTSSEVVASGWLIEDYRIWTVFVVIAVLGIVGNALVALVLLRFTDMRRRLTNIYIINQSVVDFIASLFLLLSTIFQDQSLPPGFAGELKCRLWQAKIPFWSMLQTSALNLVAITIERYLKVVHPIFHRVSFTRRVAYVTVVLIWVISIGYQFLANLPTSAVVNGQCMLQVFWPVELQRFENVIHFILQYLGPIMVFLFCYTRMAIVIQRGPFQSQHPNAPGSKVVSASSKRITNNIVKTMILVSVAFSICLSSNQWLFFLYRFNVVDWTVVYNPIYYISIIAMYINCCINPLIYAASYEQFRTAVRRIFCIQATAAVGDVNMGEINVGAGTSIGQPTKSASRLTQVTAS